MNRAVFLDLQGTLGGLHQRRRLSGSRADGIPCTRLAGVPYSTLPQESWYNGRNLLPDEERAACQVGRPGGQTGGTVEWASTL